MLSLNQEIKWANITVLTAAIPDDAKLYFFKPICHANKYKRRIDTPISVRAHIFLSTGQDKEYTDYANEILTSRIKFYRM